MFKHDMTEKQIQEKNLFVRTVVEAGWDAGEWDDLLESDLLDVEPEGHAEFDNRAAHLALGYHARESYVSLAIEAKREDDSLIFRFYFGDRLADVLNTVSAHRDTLSTENYTDAIKAIIPLCDRALYEIDDETVAVPSVD